MFLSKITSPTLVIVSFLTNITSVDFFYIHALKIRVWNLKANIQKCNTKCIYIYRIGALKLLSYTILQKDKRILIYSTFS